MKLTENLKKKESIATNKIRKCFYLDKEPIDKLAKIAEKKDITLNDCVNQILTIATKTSEE